MAQHEVVIAKGASNSCVALDVTGAVLAWQQGATNHGIRLMHADEGTPHDRGAKLFHSSDSLTNPTLRPILRIEYR